MRETCAIPSQIGASRSLAIWFDRIPAPELKEVLRNAVQRAADGLSEMLGQPVQVTAFQVDAVPIAHIPEYAGDPEAETVGIYLLLRGGLEGQALLLLPLRSALRLARLLLDESAAGGREDRAGKAPGLEESERWALAEVGNLMVTYSLNSVAASLGRQDAFYPSPPAVMFDMMAAMLDVIATPVSAQSDDLLIVACDLQTAGRRNLDANEIIRVHLWILPDPARRRIGIA